MTDPRTRLEHAIEQLGADLEPPPGWEGRVLAAVAPRRRSGLAWAWLAIPAVAAIALVAVVLPRSTRRAPEPLALTAELTSSPVMRGPSGIRAIARGGEAHCAIRIYRDGRELVAACPGHPACESSGDGLSIVLDTAPIGNYQVIAVSSAAALPAATGSPEHDLAAAIDAGASTRLQELEVR